MPLSTTPPTSYRYALGDVQRGVVCEGCIVTKTVVSLIPRNKRAFYPALEERIQGLLPSR